MVLERESGKRLQGLRRVSAGIPELVGHYPGMTLLPGSLQVECAWQCLCLLFGRSLTSPSPEHPLAFTVEWTGPSLPGETLLVSAEMTDRDHATVSFESSRGTVCSIELAGTKAILGGEA